MLSKNQSRFKETEIGKIPEDWDTVVLEAVCKKIGSGLTPRGGEKVYKKSGISLIRSQNVYNQGFAKEGLVFIDQETAEELKNVIVEKNDVLLNITGDSAARCCICPESVLPARVNQHVCIIRTDSKILDKKFLRYYFITPKMQNHMLSLAESGGTRNALTKGMIERFIVTMPSMNEQLNIVHALEVLDSKIDLNRQMNLTLEKIGQVLFKRWFIDFEFPNGKGRPYKSSGGEMVDSELGKMPRGWAVKKIGEVLELAYGKGLKETGRYTGRVPVYGSNGRVGWHNEVLVDGPGIVVGRKGNPGTVIWVQTSFYPIDTTFFVVPKSSVRSMYYLFYTLKTQDLPSLSADSAVPGLNRNIVYMNDILIPPMEVLEIFDAKIEALFKKMQANESESSLLGDVRDKLLPRFMSGKIRVKGVRDESKMWNNRRVNGYEQ